MEQNNNNTERKIKENYYLLLNLSLDPPVTDKEKIREALKAKKREWTDGSNRGNQQLKCKQYLENFNEIEAALLTDDRRLKEIIDEATKQKTKELDEILSGSEITTDEQLKNIGKNFPYFKLETIKKKIEEKNSNGINHNKVVAEPPEPKYSVAPMPDLKMDSIDGYLEVLNKKDIYSFLGYSITTPLETLKQEAQKRLEGVRQSVNKGAEPTAVKELAGMIYAFEEKDLQAYFIALKYYKIKKVLRTKFDIRIDKKTISWENYLASIEDCKKEGLSQVEAEWYVYKYFIKTRKCSPPSIPGNETTKLETQYCKFCGTENTKDAKNCSKCGKPLKIKCPACQKTVEFDVYCTFCGKSFAKIDRALELYKQAQDDKNLKIETKFNYINEAILYWPENEEFKTLKNLIEKEIKKIQELEAQKEKERELKKKKEALNNIIFTGTLSAEISGKLIKLSWPKVTSKDPSLTAKIKYRVVRKENALPANIDDGVKLSETTQLTYEDDKCVEGIIYAYAVYPVYDGVPLESGLLSKKVIIVGEITNLTNESDDKEITLKWKNPVNIIGVHCVRKKGSVPRNKDDGEQLLISGKPCSYTDRGLENKTVYGYRIMAKYQGPDGIVFSAGTTVEASPDARPTPLDIKYVIKEKEVDISWTPKPDCDIKLYYSSEMPNVSENSFISETSEVFNSFQSIKNFSKDTGKCLWKVPGSSVYYIIPAAIRSGKALIGKIAPVMPCITKLSATKIGSDLHVTWTWPSNCENVLLVWRSDKQPESVSDEKAVKNPVPKRVYDRNQAFIIKDADSSYYISVYTFKVIDKDQKIYSTPQTYVFVGESRKKKLTYSIVKKFFSGTFLNIQASSGPIPKLTLISLDRVPLSKNINAYRGGVSQEIPATNESALSIKLSSSVAKSGNYIKLFFSDPEDENQYVIEDPLKNRI